MAGIPEIDFKKCGLDADSLDDEECKKTGKAIYNAFTNVGFVYLRNTGITQYEVDLVNTTADNFFKLEANVKLKYVEHPDTSHGYIGINVERTNPKRPGDFKEAFNVSALAIANPNIKWPDEHVPGFYKEMMKFFQTCRRLSVRLLEVLSSGMDIKDRGYFQRCHSRISGERNFSTLRCLHYPPIEGDADIKPDQYRLGEHTDCGSLTLLFQDDVGGLQVENYDGGYIDAPRIPDTVLVNIGDILQFWTDGRLKSTRHRVLMPDSKSSRNVDRRSVAYFVHPDHEIILSGIYYGASEQEHHQRISPEYEKPITAFEHVVGRFKDNFKY